MSRLIDADAFFEDICDSLNQMTNIGVAVDANWLWAKLNDALENATTVNQWIPCSKRLPKEDEEVLVYLYGVAPYLAYIDSKGRWCTEYFIIGEDHEPLAWMPLPEPYTETKEEQHD